MSELPIENPYLPADKQNIDDIVDLEPLSLDELGWLHEKFAHDIDHLDAGRVEIRKTIQDKMETDSEEAGNYTASIYKKYNFRDLTADMAEGLGLIKVTRTIDKAKAKKMYLNGTDVGKVEIADVLVLRKKKEVEEK